MSELKACPFCGGQPRQIDVPCPVPGAEDCGYVAIECCFIHIHMDDMEDAITAWNTRPAPTEGEVEAGAKRAAGAGWLVDGERLDRSWDMAPEAVREHFRRMARAALGARGEGS